MSAVASNQRQKALAFLFEIADRHGYRFGGETEIVGQGPRLEMAGKN